MREREDLAKLLADLPSQEALGLVASVAEYGASFAVGAGTAKRIKRLLFAAIAEAAGRRQAADVAVTLNITVQHLPPEEQDMSQTIPQQLTATMRGDENVLEFDASPLDADGNAVTGLLPLYSVTGDPIVVLESAPTTGNVRARRIAGKSGATEITATANAEQDSTQPANTLTSVINLTVAALEAQSLNIGAVHLSADQQGAEAPAPDVAPAPPAAVPAAPAAAPAT